MQDIKPAQPIVPVRRIEHKNPQEQRREAPPKPRRRPAEHRPAENDEDTDLPHIDEYV